MAQCGHLIREVWDITCFGLYLIIPIFYITTYLVGFGKPKTAKPAPLYIGALPCL